MLFKFKYMYFGMFIILCLSFLIFFNVFYIEVWQQDPHGVSDLGAHVRIIQNSQNHHAFPIYSLWYRLVDITSGFSTNFNILAGASIFLLTFFVTLKYIMTYSILASIPQKPIFTLLTSISLALVMPIVSYYNPSMANPVKGIPLHNLHIYLGNIAPNQWHNSTLILAMPFYLWLFYFSVKNANSEQLSDFLIMGLLSVISVLCKPNYILAFLPIFCLYLLLLNYKKKHLFKGLIKISLITIPSILILLFQWYFTFKHNDLFPHPVKTIFSPFLVWGHYSPHVFISLLLSIAFPLVILIFYSKSIDSYLLMSWLVFIVALLIFSLLAEYPIYFPANYIWGAIAANYILFLFSARLLLEQPLDWKAKTAFSVLGLHVLSGLFFLSHFFIYKTSLLL